MSFRQAFKLVSKQSVTWYPGHMSKAMRQMLQRLRAVDCIVEVHDARIPFSGRNAEIQRSISDAGVKPHILVLNKKDLIEPKERGAILKELHDNEKLEHVLFTNCKNHKCSGIKRLLPLLTEVISSSNRYNRSGEKDHCVMVLGVPNVGKSSILNVLRNHNMKKKSVAQVGAIAGITRSVMERIKISEDPLTYVIDTPGILEPRVTNDEMAMKLALCGCLPDHLVGEDQIADFLLYWLNRQKRFDYVGKIGLTQPTDNAAEALHCLAVKLGAVRKCRDYDRKVRTMPDIMHAAKHFVRMFRKGELGLINLDKPFRM